jgi:hypothetical protein
VDALTIDHDVDRKDSVTVTAPLENDAMFAKNLSAP